MEALESADAHRAVLIQPLLQVLERCVTDPDRASEEDAQVFCYALYLMAKWRETRAYALVVQWLSLPEVASTSLSGDVLTQDGARILAAVSDRDLEPIKRLVLNREADEFSRGVAVAALALLTVWAEVPRDDMVDYFAWLAREGLEREPSYVWGALATESADIEALAVFPELRRAYDEGLIDPQNIGPRRAFSPDGRWIAYQSNDGGTTELFVRPSDTAGGAGGRWQISTGGVNMSVWTRRTSQLFYATGDSRLMVVDYSAAGKTFTAGKPRVWSPATLLNVGYSNMDLAPDSERFAVFLRPELAAPRVTVLLNTFDELTRKTQRRQ